MERADVKKSDLAIEKLTKECEGKEYLIPFEEYLTSICTNDRIASKILDPTKNLEDCFKTMREIAKKRQVNGCTVIGPNEGFLIIQKYYGINDEELKGGQRDVMDILDFI